MKSIVIKVGGSLIYTEDMQLNVKVLSKIKDWYKEFSRDYNKVCIVVGGGRLSRSVGKMVNQHIKKEDSKHDIAMELTQTNALVLKGYLADPKIVAPESIGDLFENLTDPDVHTVICGGLKRGWSTDMDSALCADILDLSKFYKISDIDYLYTKDPSKYIDAKPIRVITWKKYEDMFDISKSSTHKSNSHIPISVETARFCHNKRISIHLSGGKLFDTKWGLSRILESGTVIHA